MLSHSVKHIRILAWMGIFSVILLAVPVSTLLWASSPPEEGSPAGVLVQSKMVDGELPSDDPNAAAWNEAPSATFSMSAQAHWEPRASLVTVKELEVRSLNDGTNLAVLLVYKDPKENPGDAAALEFMVGDQKAHFAHGQKMSQVAGGPVDIWYWKAGENKGTNMWAKGFKTLRAQENQDVKATGAWSNGEWRVVFSRALENGSAEDKQFPVGEFTNIAFAVWDEANRETGAMKAVTSWWWFQAEPPKDPTVLVYTIGAVILVGLIELVMVRRLRKEGRTA
ncbi:MAG TPA: ethylbenzene dehydrogenase-related protein [Nitrospiria bacterium]